MGENRSKEVFVTGAVLGTVSFVVTALRSFTRVKIMRAWGADDVLIVIAELFGVGFLICLFLGASNGMGTHIETVTRQELVVLLKSNWGSSFAYNLQTMFAKLSALVFYRRVMGHHDWFRRGVDITIGFAVLLGIASVLVLFVDCRPLRYSWDKTIPNGYCWDMVLWYFINAGMNIAVDLVITVLPLPLLFQLQMPKRQKIALCGIFSLVGLVCAIGVFRVFQLPALHDSKDISWDITRAMIGYFIEAALIMIAVSGPALKPFFHCYMPALIGCSRGTYRGSASYATKESHDMQQFQRSTNVSAGASTGYGEGDSIINEELGIVKTTDVFWTVENMPRPQDGGNGRQASRTP